MENISTPKTLKIFLFNGKPTGTKIVELSSWIGKAYVIPRKRLSELLKREELESQAVYFLVGDSESGKRKIYIGEAENFKKRILQHNQKNDFWNMVVCFISKDDNLTKAHIKYLEYRMIRLSQEANRAEIENGNNGVISKLPESDIAEMEEFIENIKIIISTLGFVFLENVSIKNDEQEEIYYVKGRGGNGIIKIVDEGYVLQKGSIIAGEDSPSLRGKGISVMRFQYMQTDKVRKNQDGNFTLLDNIIFSSPSYVASFVIGNSTNGWVVLKNKNGETLDKLKRK